MRLEVGEWIFAASHREHFAAQESRPVLAIQSHKGHRGVIKGYHVPSAILCCWISSALALTHADYSSVDLVRPHLHPQFSPAHIILGNLLTIWKNTIDKNVLKNREPWKKLASGNISIVFLAIGNCCSLVHATKHIIELLDLLAEHLDILISRLSEVW